jgi:hypothetical protein
MMYPHGVVGPSPRSIEGETSPEAEAGVGRGRDSSEVVVEGEPWGRAKRRPPSEAEA